MMTGMPSPAPPLLTSAREPAGPGCRGAARPTRARPRRPDADRRRPRAPSRARRAASRSSRRSCASRCWPDPMRERRSTGSASAGRRSARRPRRSSPSSPSASAPRASSRSRAIPATGLDGLRLPDDALVAVIEGLEKPGNLGAVLRSADGAGVDAVIAASPRTDLYNPNAIRASAGTVFTVPLAAAPTGEVLAWLRDHGLRIVAARVDAERLYTDIDLTGPIALVLGAEAEGLGGAWTDADVEADPPADARRGRQPQRVGQRGDPVLRSATAARPGRDEHKGVTVDPFDFVIIGAGPAGEAAAYKARELGASVAVIDRLWFGGSCPHIGCLPSKSLLDGAARHHANPAAYEWPAASAARDYMVNRPPGAAEPDDSGHASAPDRGRRRGLPRQRHDHRAAARSASGTTPPSTTCRRGNVVVAVGSVSKMPPHRRDRRDPDLDQPRGDPCARAAAQPARPRRRPDRLRARPGLRPVRRPDDHRPVRTAARADRPPAQLRGAPQGARAGRGHRPDRRPGAPGEGGCRARRRARDRPRRRLDGGRARHPARGRAVVPARGPRSRALRHRHDRPDAVPARRPPAHRATACG